LTPAQNFYGDVQINISVTDGEYTDYTIFILTVLPVNDTPTIELPESFTFEEDGSLVENFSGFVDDIDQDGLVLTVSGTENITVSINDFEVTFGAVQDWNGTETLTFTVNDNQGRAIASDDVDIIVTPVNDAPWFTSVPEDSVLEDEEYSYTMTADDVDENEYLTFYLTESPDWLTFDGNSTIFGTPENGDVGVHNVTVTVSDGFLPGDVTVEQSFIITVVNTNDAPSFHLSNAPVGLYEDFTQIETIEILDFYDPDEGSVETITGFELNAHIED